MENYLEEINAVFGVTGSFVCLRDGGLAIHALPKLDVASVENAARIAAQTLYALETSGQHVSEVDLVYNQGRLLMKNLRGGILVIVCARNINIPLLNLTANVVAKKIAVELRPPKIVPAAAAPSLPTTEEPSPTVMPVSEATVGPIDAVDGMFFDELTRELSRMIGPAGRIVIEEEVDALKEVRENFPKARTAELVEHVSTAIRDETKRAKFKQVMLEAIQKL